MLLHHHSTVCSSSTAGALCVEEHEQQFVSNNGTASTRDAQILSTYQRVTIKYHLKTVIQEASRKSYPVNNVNI